MTDKEQLVIDNALRFAEELFENDFGGHDFSHTLRVYHTALSLAQEEQADVFVCALAALLHDADDIKLFPGIFGHADNALRFMKNEGLPDETAKAVIGIISEVSFRGGRQCCAVFR